MEFKDVIVKRSATRKFSNQSLEQDKIDYILEAGRLAPTAKNIEPFKIYVISSEEGITKIDQITPCRYNAPVVLLVCGDKDEAFTKDGYSTYEMDASIVATHMMLAATDIGVDNIWVELFDKELAKKEFNLPNNLQPVCLLPVGYKAMDCPISPNHNKRKIIEDLVIYK